LELTAPPEPTSWNKEDLFELLRKEGKRCREGKGGKVREDREMAEKEKGREGK